MHSFFPSKYPIMCAIMNKVSNLEFAIDCADVGIMPGIMVPYKENSNDCPDFSIINKNIIEFKNHTGNTNLNLAVDLIDLLDYKFLKFLANLKLHSITFIPIGLGSLNKLDDYQHVQNNFKILMNAIKIFKHNSNTKILMRKRDTDFSLLNKSIDAICVKGNDGAGEFQTDLSTKELFNLFKKSYQHIIPHGGIGTAEQVEYYLTNGAAAVAIGTLFASSKESCLSLQTKLKICNSNVENVYIIPDTNQNSLIMGTKEEIENDVSGWNRSKSLEQGIHNGNHGHIYVGHAINHVNEIESLKTIVERLMSWKI